MMELLESLLGLLKGLGLSVHCKAVVAVAVVVAGGTAY